MTKIKGIPFGYKNSWFVFKSADYDNVKQGLLTYFDFVRSDTVENGLKAGWDGGWCLLGPINDFIFLISSDGYKFREQAKELSSHIPEVHFYSTHRSSDYLVCSKYMNGHIIRDFSVGDGEINFNIGEPTDIELILGKKQKEKSLIDSKDDKVLFEHYNNLEPLAFLGAESNLMEIAGQWSTDPSQLDKMEIENTCYILQLKNSKTATGIGPANNSQGGNSIGFWSRIKKWFGG